MKSNNRSHRAMLPRGQKKRGWKTELNLLAMEFGYRCYGNHRKRRAAHSTMKKRCQVLFLLFKQLHEGGFKIENPRNLRPQHVHFLMRSWEDQGLSASVLANRFSIIKSFCDFMGKPGMLGDPENFVRDPASLHRSTIAQRDKSWVGNNVNADEIVRLVEEHDPYTAIQIRMMHAFGLRLKEAVSIQPVLADHGDCIMVDRGTKGGRPRLVPIDSEAKREVLDAAKQLLKKPTQNLCRPGKKIHQEIARHYYIVRKVGITAKQLGVTPHGLRHEYLNDRYEEIAGHPSPIRGGEIVDKEQDELARAITMQHAGHGRLTIGSAYYGSSRPARKSNHTTSKENEDES